MRNPDHDPEEAGLRALFDQSADELDGPGLTKLRARTADIPGQRRPAWWRVWSPAFALAMGALVVFGIRSLNQPASVAMVAQNTASAPAPSPATIASTPPAASEEPTPEAEEPEELALGEEDDDMDMDMDIDTTDDELELDDGSDGLLAFGAPSSDEEIDAWLAATDELLGEGG